jgi:uncharacterized protein YdeI (YjbR/CyaY-like superfamily)
VQAKEETSNALHHPDASTTVAYLICDMGKDLSILTVPDVTSWRQWLEKEAARSPGVWLTLAKKGAQRPTSLTYAEALDEALCHGWIDGQTKSVDEKTYSHRFTPRAKKSMWSAKNVTNVARLEDEGRMLPAGRAAVDAAKVDGRWDKAYAGQSDAEPPEDLLAAIAAVPAAQMTFQTLSKQNIFAMYFRLNALRTQAGRDKRIAAFVNMLARGETLHPQKSTAPTRGETASRISKPSVTRARRKSRSGTRKTSR